MMIITTASKYAKVRYGNDTFTHAIDSISYAINDDWTGVTLFNNNKVIGSAPISETIVDGKTLTVENANSILSKLFDTQNVYSNSKKQKSAENITSTSSKENYVTISANCESSGIVYYSTDVENLPDNVCGNDLGYITSDGSADGELIYVFEYNGFEWVLKSFKPNLIVFNDSDEYSITLDKSNCKEFLRSKNLGYESYRIVALDTAIPIEISNSIALKDYPKLLVQDGNYYFSSLNFYLTQENTTISELDTKTILNVINHEQDDQDIKTKTLTIQDCGLYHIYVYDPYVKDLTIKNITTEADSSMISLNINAYGSINLENISTPVRLLPSYVMATDINYGDRILNFSNVTFDEFNIHSLSNMDNESIHTSEVLNFSDVTINGDIDITNTWISSANFTNVELTPNEGNSYRNINLAEISFNDQTSCDEICASFGKLLYSGDNFTMSIDNNNSNQLKPSQAILDEMTSRGIEISIN